MRLIKPVILTLLFFSIELFPQSWTAVPVLKFTTSPILYGAGEIGTASTINDPFAFHANPAILGHSSINNFTQVGYSNLDIDIQDFSHFTMHNAALSGGYKLNPCFSLGLGLNYTRYNVETSFNRFEDHDTYISLSAGAGYHSTFNLSGGITIKHISSTVTDFYPGRLDRQFTADRYAFDFGLLFNLPINHLLCKPIEFSLDNDNSIMPSLDYTIGYSLQNLGDEIYYVDEAQSDPLPRRARLAHSVELGFKWVSPDININLLNLSYSLDATDILVKRNINFVPGDLSPEISTEYQGLLGDIKPGRNLFRGKGDDYTRVHIGGIIDIFETVTVMIGGFNGEGISQETSGFALRLRGLSKLLDKYNPSVFSKFMKEKFDIQFVSSTHDLEVFQRNHMGIIISVNPF